MRKYVARTVAAGLLAFGLLFAAHNPANATPAALVVLTTSASVVEATGAAAAATAFVPVVAVAALTVGSMYLCYRYCGSIGASIGSRLGLSYAVPGTTGGTWIESPSPQSLPVSDSYAQFVIGPVTQGDAVNVQVLCLNPNDPYHDLTVLTTGKTVTQSASTMSLQPMIQNRCYLPQVAEVTVSWGNSTAHWKAAGEGWWFYDQPVAQIVVECETPGGTKYTLQSTALLNADGSAGSMTVPACSEGDWRPSVTTYHWTPQGQKLQTKKVSISSAAQSNGELLVYNGSTATQVSPSPSPSPTATANPTTDPLQEPAAEPSAWRDCIPDGWGLLNPLAYGGVTVCLAKLLVIPKPETFTDTLTEVQAAWDTAPAGEFVTAMVAVPASLSGFGGFGNGCQGPAVQVPLSTGSSPTVIHPWQACTEPMSTVAGVVRTVSGIVILFGGALLVYAPIAASLGLPPIRMKSGDDV